MHVGTKWVRHEIKRSKERVSPLFSFFFNRHQRKKLTFFLNAQQSNAPFSCIRKILKNYLLNIKVTGHNEIVNLRVEFAV